MNTNPMNDPNNDISAEILAGPMHYQKEIQNSEVPASMKFINHESSATSSQKQQAIVIVGSVNADVYLEIDYLPREGETVNAKPGSGVVRAGGKGANTAVAVARLQASSSPKAKFACRFGNDADGKQLHETLTSNNLDLSLAHITESPNGHAYILLQPNGNNSIIISAGANHDWFSHSDEALLTSVESARLLLLQREIPESVNAAVIGAAEMAKVPVFFDMGGETTPIAPELLQNLFLIAPNETELERLTKKQIKNDEDMKETVKLVQEMGVQNVLVTLGNQGARLYLANGEILEQPCFAVKVVDTTGAGDTFRGAFAVAYAEGHPWQHCLLFASAASALCVTKLGAMNAVPYREEVENFIKNHMPKQ